MKIRILQATIIHSEGQVNITLVMLARAGLRPEQINHANIRLATEAIVKGLAIKIKQRCTLLHAEIIAEPPG